MANFSKICLEYSTVVFAKIRGLTLGMGIGARGQPFFEPKRHGMRFKG